MASNNTSAVRLTICKITANNACAQAIVFIFFCMAVWLIEHRPVHGRSSVGFVKDFQNLPALWDTVRRPFRYRTEPGRSPLKSYDLILNRIIRCVETPAGRLPTTIRCPAPHYPQCPYKTPYGCREILSSTLTSSDTARCLKWRRTGAVKTYDSLVTPFGSRRWIVTIALLDRGPSDSVWITQRFTCKIAHN